MVEYCGPTHVARGTATGEPDRVVLFLGFQHEHADSVVAWVDGGPWPRTRRTVRNARKVALVPASSVNTGPVAQSTHDGIILWVNDTLCVILHRLSGTRHRRVECFQSCKAWCHLSCRLFHLMAFPRTEQFRAICSAMLCDDEI